MPVCLFPCLLEMLPVCLLVVVVLLSRGEVGTLCLVSSRGEAGGEVSIGSSATHSPAHGADLSIRI